MDFIYVIICFALLVLASSKPLNFLPLMTGGQAEEAKDLTLYYAPWCGHCKKLMPEWEKVKSALKAIPSIKINTINTEENPKLAERAGVKSFPTIFLRKGGENRTYDGPRTAKALINFVKNA